MFVNKNRFWMMHLYSLFKPFKLGIKKGGITTEYELVEIKDYLLPLLDEPFPASIGAKYESTRKSMGRKINSPDAFIFVTYKANEKEKGESVSPTFKYRNKFQK
jgi:hypothetical protein